MTPRRGAVLVVASATDPTADRVCDALATRQTHFFRFDTSDFPQRLRVRAELGTTLWRGTLATAEDRLDLHDIRTVYVRRPSAFDVPEHLTPIEQWHAAIEARYALGGLLGSLPVRWCNNPSRSADAAYKVKQLADFRACGLATPPTLVTNCADDVRVFADQVGQLICKPIVVGVVRTGRSAHAVYTRLVTADELNELTGIDYTAHLFQSFVAKQCDVRLNVVGEQYFAVRINSGSEQARIDWRADYSALSYEVIDTPPEIRASVSAYMKMVGLTFGAFDFAVDHEGAWIALEINPEGQFGWIEQETGVPVTEAIADFLTEGLES